MKKIIVLAAVFFLSGCGSIATHSEGCYQEYYQGTERMVNLGHWAWILWIDVPFSAVVDTLTLPVDAVCIGTH